MVESTQESASLKEHVNGGGIIELKTRSRQIDVELRHGGMIFHRAQEVGRRISIPLLKE